MTRLPCGGTPYEDVAVVVKEHSLGLELSDDRNVEHKCLADDLADLFAANNPEFDRDKFLSDCGLTK